MRMCRCTVQGVSEDPWSSDLTVTHCFAAGR